jgi:hypothetical protein
MGIGSMASSIISLCLPYLAYLVRIIFWNFSCFQIKLFDQRVNTGFGYLLL